MWKLKGNTTKPGNPLWDEYVEVGVNGEETGRSSLNTITPVKITNFENCDHYYEYENGGNDAMCKHCGYAHKIVAGLQLVQNGRIVSNHPTVIKNS